MNKVGPWVILLVLVLAGPALAKPGALDEARQLLQTGKYAEAEAAFRKLIRTSSKSEAQLGLARVQLETGRFGDAIAAARKGARGKLWSQGMTLVAEAQRELGQLAAAQTTLKQVEAKDPKHYRARLLLGLTQLEQGKAAEAKQVFDGFYDDYAADRIDKKSAEQLTYVAMACRYTDNFRDAGDTLADAIQIDPRHVEAHVEWAEISLEKYEAGYAEQHYNGALKINPNHADALVGLARVKLEQSNDVDEALKLLQRAEKVNPAQMDSVVVRAQILIDAEQYQQAEAILTQALQRNPNHLDALSMMAASFFMRDDLGSFKRMRSQVLKLNPRYTQFFRTVVQLAVRHHRYAEAIDLGKQAIAIDPDDWYSLADLGTNYLRLGDDAKGLAYLKQAWKGDRFNVRNYNLLNLFDDVVAKEYTFVSSKHFRLRVHREDQELVKRTVVPLLERAFAIYAKKYKYTPPRPITVELFRDSTHYAVRAVGTPGLSALAVCFGQVITAMSPFAGRFNWGQVLWHELNHVFTIQLSRSRVPRWLTEGLADLEPTLERAEWRRENDFDIYRALRKGTIKGLEGMGTAFSRARSIDEMVVAYYQGSLVTAFMIKQWGLDKVVAALRAYGKGRRTRQILPQVTGLTLEQLDRRFQAEQRKRLAHYKGSWYVDPEDYRDRKARKRDADARPRDAAAQAALAMALLAAGRAPQADQQAAKALALDAKDRVALYVRAEAALERKERKLAEQLFGKLIAAGGDGFQARMALGQLAVARKDLGAAATHLAAAKRFDPERVSPYALLARAYEKTGQDDKLVAELKGLARLDQQRFSPVAKLVDLLARRKDYAGVRTYGQMAYYINPASAKLHEHLADAFAAPAPRPALSRAIWHLETALLCQPQRPADLHVKLAKLLARKGDRGRAKAALERALKADPSHAGARALKGQLK